MLVKRLSSLCITFLFCACVLIACSQKIPRALISTTHTTGKAHPTPIVSLSPATAKATPGTTPTRYKAHLLLTGRYRPDDLAFDPAGHLVFSDIYHGTVSRLNANGSVTVLVSGLAEPEGLVFLPNGTLIIAEQKTNRILAFSPATSSLTVLRVLPGWPSGPPCKDGVDGIALAPTTQTLIVPITPLANASPFTLTHKNPSPPPS